MSMKRFGALLLAGTMIFANAACAEDAAALDPAAVSADAETGAIQISDASGAGDLPEEAVDTAAEDEIAISDDDASEETSEEDGAASGETSAEDGTATGETSAEDGTASDIIEDDDLNPDGTDTGAADAQDLSDEGTADGIIEENTGDEDVKPDEESGKISVMLSYEMPISNDEALIRYMESFIHKENRTRKRNISRRNQTGVLSELEAEAYDEILPQVQNLTKGLTDEAAFTFTLKQDADSYDIGKICLALTADHPELFYWGRGNCQYISKDRDQLTLYFSVGNEYQLYPGTTDEDLTNMVNKTAIGRINAAAESASEYIRQAASKDDYDKLHFFMETVDRLNVYNEEATTWDASDNREDPWEIIYVFDGDPSTNVVCEGYSKAMKYLCDHSKFADKELDIYTATGYVYDNENYLNGGAHMWNIVHTSIGNYLLDATWCDADYYGYSDVYSTDQQFMVGGEKNRKGDWVFRWGENEFPIGNHGYEEAGVAMYEFDEDAEAIYSEDELTFSESSYKEDLENSGKKPAETETETETPVETETETETETESPKAPETESIPRLDPPAPQQTAPQQAALQSNPSFEDSVIPLKKGQNSPAIQVLGIAAGDGIAKVTSDNTQIAVPSVAGPSSIRVKGGRKNKGKATITVVLTSGRTAAFTVKLQKKKVTTRKIIVSTEKKLTVSKGRFIDIAAKLKPITSADKVTYTSSKPKVASVRGGRIYGRKKGKAVITVKAGRKKVRIRVTVQ